MIGKLVRLLKAIIFVLWLVFMFAFGMLIYSENESTVDVSFVVFEFTALPLGVLISSVLAVGVLVGFLTSFFISGGRVMVQKGRYKKVSRELEKLKAAQSEG